MLLTSPAARHLPRLAAVLLFALCAPAGAAQYAPLVAQDPNGPVPPLARRAGGPDLLARAGHPVLINFWATWCEPCREEMPALDQLRREHPDIEVYTVAVGDSRSEVARFLDEYLLDLPVIHDPEQLQSRAWGVRILPTTVVLDARHHLRFRATGALDWSKKPVDAVLRQLGPATGH